MPFIEFYIDFCSYNEYKLQVLSVIPLTLVKIYCFLGQIRTETFLIVKKVFLVTYDFMTMIGRHLDQMNQV